MLILLEINDIALDYTQNELVSLGLGIAGGIIKPQQLNKWIADHIRPTT